MAARVDDDTVKAPGALVVSSYAPCEDITATATPDLKCANGEGKLATDSVRSSCGGKLATDSVLSSYGGKLATDSVRSSHGGAV